MLFVVYQITNTNSGKYYRGKTNLERWEDGYMGGGSLIKRSVKKYGRESFKREILYRFYCEQTAYEFEWMVVVQRINDKQSYNIQPGGKGKKSGDENPIKGSRSFSEKISAGLVKRWAVPGTREKASSVAKKAWTPEKKKEQSKLITKTNSCPKVRKSLSDAGIERYKDPEERRKTKERAIIAWADEEKRQKAREKSLKFWADPEHREKRRIKKEERRIKNAILNGDRDLFGLLYP